MAHIPFDKITDTLSLPSDKCVVTGRVNAWLYQKSEDIEAASCYVVAVDKTTTGLTLIDVIIDIASKLQANGGVNLYLEDIERVLNEIQAVDTENVKALSKQIYYFDVADSLRLQKESSKERFPDHISIYDSWRILWDAILTGKEVVFDFSEVREASKTASGRESFIDILEEFRKLIETPTLTNFLKALSKVNELIKRGGFRKTGALTTSFAIQNSNIFEEYLNLPFAALPYVKKSIIYDPYNSYPSDSIKKILNKYNKGEIFIEKKLDKVKNKQLVSNVCRGITLVPDDQCLISHVNLGQIRNPSEISEAFEEVTQFLCDVHEYQKEKGVHMVDNQIAVGMTGLANLLKNFKIGYSEFIQELYLYVQYNKKMDGCDDIHLYCADNKITGKQEKIVEIIREIDHGFHAASYIGSAYGMRATLTIEPCESCSRRYKDLYSYDLVPNVSPPNVIEGQGIEKRHSDIDLLDEQGNIIAPTFFYGIDIEPASNITSEEHYYLWDSLQYLMNMTGQAHMSSYEHWGDLSTFDFDRWLNGDLKSLYYCRQDIGTNHLNKGQTIRDAFNRFNECVTCGD